MIALSSAEVQQVTAGWAHFGAQRTPIPQIFPISKASWEVIWLANPFSDVFKSSRDCITSSMVNRQQKPHLI